MKAHDTQEQLMLETKGCKEKEDQSKMSSLSSLSKKALYHSAHKKKAPAKFNINLPVLQKPHLVLGQQKILHKYNHGIEAQQPKLEPKN